MGTDKVVVAFVGGISPRTDGGRNIDGVQTERCCVTSYVTVSQPQNVIIINYLQI